MTQPTICLENSFKSLCTIEDLLYTIPFRYIKVHDEEEKKGRKKHLCKRNQRDKKGNVKTYTDKKGKLQKSKIWFEMNNYTLEAINKNKGVQKESTHKSYYLNMSNNYVIDVDEKVNSVNELPDDIKDFIKKYKIPYTRGSTKGFHLYIECTDAPDYSNVENKYISFRGDLIHKGNNIWEKHGREVYGNNKIPLIPWADWKHLFKPDEDIITGIMGGKKEKSKDIVSIENNEIIESSNVSEEVKKEFSNDIFNIYVDLFDYCFNKERFDNYNDWRNIGMALKNIYGEEGFDTFNYFSSKGEKYNKEHVRTIYNTFVEDYNNKFNKDGYTPATIYKYAKDDNYDEYKRIMKKYNKKVDEDDIFNILNDSQTKTAMYLKKKFKHDVFKTGENHYYIYNEKLCLWVLSNYSSLVSYISKYIYNEFNLLILNEALKNIPNDILIIEYLKSKKQFTTQRYINDVAKFYKGFNYDKGYADKLDSRKDILSFKNGIYELRTGKFRERTKTDFITKTLDFDYTEEVDIKIKKEIKQMILRISNDDKNICKSNKRWLGYCTTGETHEQLMLFLVGYSASNGKSSLCKMYKYSLPIYSCEIDNRTFTNDYSKAHKQLKLVGKPVRFCVIEELSKKGLNIDLFKKFVDGGEITNEVLFSTTEYILNHSKLNITSNTDPKFSTDSGIKRRGRVVILQNKFLSKTDKTYKEGLKGVYLQDENFDKKFKENVKYKMEFIRILMKYAKIYYEEGLKLDDSYKSQFEELCEDNDNMRAFLNRYYEVTHDIVDKISKDDFVDHYNFINKTKLKWTHLMSDVKRVGLIYDRRKMINGVQGVIIGLKLKDDNKENEDLDY